MNTTNKLQTRECRT